MDKLHTCPCCGEKTLEEQGGYEICDVCDWEDDPGQSKFPDDDLGANGVSLNQYRSEWKKSKREKTA